MKKAKSFYALLRSINVLAFKDPRIRIHMRWLVAMGVVVSLLPTAGSYAFSLISNSLQDAYSSVGHVERGILALMAIGYVFLMILPLMLRTLDRRFFWRVFSYLSHHLSVLLKRKLGDLDNAYFDDPDFHDKLKNVREKGADKARDLFLMQVDALEALLGIFVSLAVILAMGWGYVAVLIVSLAPILLTGLSSRKLRKSLADQNRAEARYANAYASGMGTRESRVFGTNERYLERYSSISEDILGRSIRFDDQRSWVSVLAWAAHGIGIGFVVYAAFAMIADGEKKIGTGLFMVSSMWTLSASVRTAIMLAAEFYESLMYAEEFVDVLDLPPVMVRRSDALKFSAMQGPSIEFQDVSFWYPGKEDKPALKNVSFKIEAGKKVVLAGENGGGKSTTVKLILGEYAPSKGKILVDGKDLADIDLVTWKSIIGYVAQGPSVPDLKIREVLEHGGALEEALLASALKRSGSDQFIADYKQGTEQQLGKMFKGGVNPSNGQRQRLSIARAYTKETHLLVFDEPTADLDPESQHQVFTDFYEGNPNRTGILIAHAMQGTMRADSIMVFEKGEITESGTFEELVSAGGWYEASYRKQSSPFTAFAQ